MSAPTIILRLDLTGTAFGSAPTYTDYSSHLATAGDGQPININWGRQDKDSEVQPSTCTFELENTTGQWTPGNAAADVDWDVGAPVNIRVVHNAVTYDRFTGYVDTIEPAYPGQNWSQVVVTCSDITARMGRGNPLQSIYEYEALADSPLGLWPCDDAGGSKYARNAVTAGRAGRLRLSTARGKDDLVAMGGPEGGGALAGDPTSSLSLHGTAGTAIGTETKNVTGGYLDTSPAGAFVSVTAGHGISVEGWVNTTDMLTNLFGLLFQQVDGTGTVQASVWLWGDGTLGGYWIEAAVTGAGGVLGIAKSALVTDGDWHHWAITVPTGGGSIKLYIDGVQVGSSTLGAATFSGGASQTWGGAATSVGAFYNWLNAAVKHQAVYNTELSAARVLAHFQAGAGPVERTDQRFTRIAANGGVTVTGLPTGSGTVASQVTGGVTALEALKLVGRSEGAPVYATKTGALTMQARNARYGAAVVATLTGADVNPDLTTRRDRQGLVNEATVNRAGSEQPITASDATSISRHGRFQASTDVALNSDTDAQALAQWMVATGKNPLTRLPDLTVDLLTGQSVAIVTAALTLDISSKVQVTGMPSQAPASTFTGFIEGATETIGVDDWRIGFFTSPVTLEDSLFTLDNTPLGQLNDGGVLAF